MSKATKGKDPKTYTRDDLTYQEQIFIDEYLKELQPYKAAKAANYSDSLARSRAYSWVKSPESDKPYMYYMVQEAMKERSIRTQVTADKVLEHWWKIATADPNELTQIRRLNCRNCHGIDHNYQWVDEAEFEQALDSFHEQVEKVRLVVPNYDPEPPNDQGGYGFIPINSPNLECPVCFGEGKVDLYLADTRNLSPHGQALYAGAKMTKTGYEVMMHDQAAALNNVARHLGMFNDKITLAGDKKNPIAMLLEQLPGNTLKPNS